MGGEEQIDFFSLTYVAFMMDQRAPTTSKIILFKDGDFEPGFCKSGCCSNSTDARTFFFWFGKNDISLGVLAQIKYSCIHV